MFEDGQSLADHKCLKQLGVEAGLSPESIDELLASDRFADQVKMDELAAARQDVHGVPYFIMGNRYIVPGALPIADMKGVLEKLIEELGLELSKAIDSDASNVNHESTSDQTGSCCGPDGCAF